MATEQIVLEAETYHDKAKMLEVPKVAFLVYGDDNPDIHCFYSLIDLRDAA
jgi:hypothetical protein